MRPPPWPQPLSAASHAVIVDRDVKFMGNLHSAAASGPPYGAGVGKRRNRYVRQSLSDLSPPNAKSRSHPTSTEPRPHSFTPPPPPPSYPRSLDPRFCSLLRSLAPDPKVIMQYRDDFVGSSRSYFSLFCRRRTLAPVVTIIYEGCVPGIQCGPVSHVRGHMRRGRMASSSG